MELAIRSRSYGLYQAILVVFVLVVSFLYGLVKGLHPELTLASAFSLAPFDEVTESDLVQYQPRRIAAARGLEFTPLGRNVRLNGKDAEMLFFQSHRDVEDIVDEQVQIWESRGLVTSGKTGPQKGVGVATNTRSGERYLITAWTVPEGERAEISQGRQTQGVLSVATSALTALANPDGVLGIVPGVPLMPGATAGALFSSEESDGRSYTSAYTAHVDVATAAEFYRTTLQSGGWKLLTPEESILENHTMLQFIRNEELITLLFSGIVDEVKSRSSYETLITVTRAPRGALAPYGEVFPRW